jgi:excisionase family DNA binding protein
MEAVRIDTRAAARRLGICVVTVRRMIRAGILPAVRKGRGCYLIRLEDLDRVFVEVRPDPTK